MFNFFALDWIYLFHFGVIKFECETKNIDVPTVSSLILIVLVY